MKTKYNVLAAVAAICALLFCTGCQTSAKSDDGKVPVSLIQKALDETLPPAHQGAVEFEWGGDYLKLEVKGDGLKRTAAGWTYTWLSYRRTLNFPWFTGLNYKNGAWVMLGKKPQ